ncbi:MAG TPA: hypothetical protein PKA10_08305 [Selenomonadales bacterium]|nr:hypothetical protein [Selenomonadales bacterium]
MLRLWYVRDGEVEEYGGQAPDWETSFVVCAGSPEKAVINVLHYRQGCLERVDILYHDKTVTVIP